MVFDVSHPHLVIFCPRKFPTPVVHEDVRARSIGVLYLYGDVPFRWTGIRRGNLPEYGGVDDGLHSCEAT